MNRRNVLWLAAAVALPALLWLAAPRNASWAATDDRLREIATPAGVPLVGAPQWAPQTERALFLSQAATGIALLAASLRRMKTRRKRGGPDAH